MQSPQNQQLSFNENDSYVFGKQADNVLNNYQLKTCQKGSLTRNADSVENIASHHEHKIKGKFTEYVDGSRSVER